jgi:hypothetical protein
MSTIPVRRGTPVPAPDQSLASDRLDGARAIAAFWFGADTRENKRKVFRLIDLKVIPVAKVGGRLIASKRALSERYRQLTSGQAEAAD